MKTLTIFTPTYNRASLLPRLYRSLLEQRNLDFMWLIVDDGSNDETELVVSKWIQDGILKIQYFKQQNKGKMKAHNTGVGLCSTPLFLCVDSDDSLCPHAVQSIIDFYKLIQNDETICGFIGQKKTEEVSGRNQLATYSLSTLYNLYASGFKGETALVFKTKVLKEFTFPEIPNEKFITEAYIYDQIDQQFRYMQVGEYWIDCEYLEDGYTKNSLKLRRDYPIGWMMFFKQRYLICNLGLLGSIRCMANYICSSLFAGKNFVSIIWESPSIFNCILCFPLGVRYYINMKKKLD